MSRLTIHMLMIPQCCYGFDVIDNSEIAELLDSTGRGLKSAIENLKQADGKNALHIAAGAGKLELCKYLIDKVEIDLNLLDDSGYSALNYAYRKQRYEVVEYLQHHSTNHWPIDPLPPIRGDPLQSISIISDPSELAKEATTIDIPERAKKAKTVSEKQIINLKEILKKYPALSKEEVWSDAVKMQSYRNTKKEALKQDAPPTAEEGSFTWNPHDQCWGCKHSKIKKDRCQLQSCLFSRLDAVIIVKRVEYASSEHG